MSGVDRRVLVRVADRDLARLGFLRDRDGQPQDPVAVLGLDGFGVQVVAYETDVELTKLAGEVPDANACKGCSAVGEGKAFGYAFGADPGTQIGECLRQPSQVFLGDPGREIDVAVGGTAAACSSPAYPR